MRLGGNNLTISGYNALKIKNGYVKIAKVTVFS